MRYSVARAYSLRPLEFRPFFFVVLTIILFPLIAFAQTPAAPQRTILAQQQALQKKHNEGRLMILGGYPGTTYFNLVHDMAAAVAGKRGDLRLIALDAPGGIESLRDLLLLRGVDLAVVPENVLDYADAMATFGPALRRLSYVTQLCREEVHFLVGPGTDSFENLRGKKVAVPPEDGNAEFTVRDLLRRLRIDAEVIKVAAADAIDDVRSGTFAALVLMGGRPLQFVAKLPKDGSLRLLALPSTQALGGDDYSPSSFSADDYPALISAEQTIDAVSVSAVLVANNATKSEESTRRIAKFVPAFFGALSELGGPPWHPKWSEVNLAATLTRWPRFPTAKEWLDRTLREQTASVQREFDQFPQVKGSPTRSREERRQLFAEYLATGADLQKTNNMIAKSPVGLLVRETEKSGA
jgi:TRAP-type uncharacterized transport system substrate-binding protein